jgi:hypothetical protein
MPKSFATSTGGGGGSIVVGTTPSDGTANTLLKTNATGEVGDATGLTNTATGQLIVTAQAATDVPLSVKGAASQSGNYFEINSSAGSGGDAFVVMGNNIVQLGNTGGGSGLLRTLGIALGFQGAGNISLSLENVGAVFTVDANATAGNTRGSIWDVDNNQLERISVGAADSGGAGFKVLRIPN